MKRKALWALALAACLGYVPAQAESVVSENIVGYEKITIPVNAQDIMGVQFQNVGSDGTFNLQDIVPNGYNERGVDWIKIYDPASSRYVTAYYWGESADGGVYENADAEEPLGPGWGDKDQNVVDVTLDAGQGFWTQAVAGGTLTIAGEVSSDNTVTVPANAMTLVTSPLPMPVSLQDIVPEGYNERGVDWIKIYNPETSRYVTAYYWGASADGGVYENADAEEPLGPGWGDKDQNVIDIDIAYGQGFWTQAVAGGNLKFPAVGADGE